MVLNEADQAPSTLLDKRRALMELQMRRRRAELAGSGGVVPVGRDGLLPLSWQQLGLWFLYEWDSESATYHMPLALRLRGGLDVAALGAALRAVLVRHEGLRTRVQVSDGQPWQVVLPAPEVLWLAVVELPARGWVEVVDEEVRRPFRLVQEPGFRWFLGRLADDDHVLVLTSHHIITDGWSIGIVTADLSAAYRQACLIGADGSTAVSAGQDVLLGLPPLPIQPADHAHWQRENRDRLNAGIEYWTEQLANLPTLALPADRTRPAAPTGYGKGVSGKFDADVAGRLIALATTLQVSPLAVLLAGFGIVLHRYSGQPDLPVGSVFSGRTRTELEPLVGYFANTLVLRTTIDNPHTTTVTRHIRSCHNTILQAMQYQDTPFTLVVDTLQPPRTPGQNPLFQIALSLAPSQVTRGTLDLPGITLEPVLADQGAGARFDLRFEVVPQADGSMDIWVEYSTELFDEWRVRSMIEHFRNAVGALVAAPEQLVADVEFVSAAELDRVRFGFNQDAELPATELPWRNGTVVAVAAETARVAAGACAVWCEGAWLSYAQLDQAATTLAVRLVTAGVRRGQVVALCAYRSLELVVGLLAVLKAGAAYLPLDPDQPVARSAFQLADSGAVALLSQPGIGPEPVAGTIRIELLPPDQVHTGDPDAGCADEYVDVPGAQLLPAIDGRDSAYLIYTSGSTGQPKGVLSHHAGLINRLGWMQARYPIDDRDRVLQKTPYTFDVSVWEFLWPLLTGARLVLAAPQGHRDPGYLAQVLAEQRISISHFVPSVLGTFLNQTDQPDPAGLPALRHLFCSGEALPAATRDQTLRRFPHLRLHNLYGPTEASIDVTAWTCQVSDGPTVVIGRPITNLQTYVLDVAGKLAPVGVTGRLHLAGVGLAHGYLGQPGLTAERFVPCPFGEPGSRMYDTGDLARWRPDGTLEYHGRTDHQVKLHGQRIELGEIEHALTRQPGVTAAAVILVEPAGDGAAHLAAYLTVDGVAPTETVLRARLADQLPLHMIPATVTVLDTLPLSANGKLDRSRLPAPRTEPAVAPTATERTLAEIWIGLLNRNTPVRPEHNFFSEGGSSLLVMRLISRMRETFGVEITVRQVFLLPVLRDLAAEIDRAAAEFALGDADISSIEAQLDTMSDEDIERMLAEGLGDGSLQNIEGDSG